MLMTVRLLVPVVVVAKGKTMNLSHYVYADGDYLFNIVNLKILHKTAPIEVLRKHNFLSGQERDAVNERLFAYNNEQTSIGIKIIPTWECNLRCKHCFVLHKLQKTDSNVFDTDGFIEFVSSVLDTKPSIREVALGFVGGEVALTPLKCVEILDKTKEYLLQRGDGVKLASTLTTNGTIFNKDFAELLARVDLITFSVDGTQEQHNDQRKGFLPIYRENNLYRLTLRNIKRAVLMGFRDKIIAQGALNEIDDELIKEMRRELIKVGVKAKNITPGCVVPTRMNKHQTDVYREYIATNLYLYPCCKYRLGKEYVVDNTGHVYCDYFAYDEESSLGKLREHGFDHILSTHRQLIEQHMPVLNDEKCKKCPVLGVCWGRCCNTDFLVPSSVCDQESLHRIVNNYASEGKLIEFFKDSKMRKEISYIEETHVS